MATENHYFQICRGNSGGSWGEHPPILLRIDFQSNWVSGRFKSTIFMRRCCRNGIESPSSREKLNVLLWLIPYSRTIFQEVSFSSQSMAYRGTCGRHYYFYHNDTCDTSACIFHVVLESRNRELCTTFNHYLWISSAAAHQWGSFSFSRSWRICFSSPGWSRYLCSLSPAYPSSHCLMCYQGHQEGGGNTLSVGITCVRSDPASLISMLSWWSESLKLETVD